MNIVSEYTFKNIYYKFEVKYLKLYVRYDINVIIQKYKND